jgi:Baseplate J-like protein
MTRNHEDQVQDMFPSLENKHRENVQETPEAGLQQSQTATIHIHYFKDGIVILKEEEQAQVVDSRQEVSRKTSLLPAYIFCGCYMLLIVATVTIIPASQTQTLSGRLQLGRVLSPLTITQAQTIPTTGIGHQSAKSATGLVTFYNGQFQSVMIAAGTIFTGTSGVQISTDHEATIPAGHPPSYGQASVQAHAVNPGSQGNIPAYDINQVCCAASVFAKNTEVFTGGQDARTYTTVTQDDIHNLSTVLKTTVAHSINGALQGQLRVSRSRSCAATKQYHHTTQCSYYFIVYS